ncbi:hypothetical protein [Streptomyces sp. NBC_00448]
MRIPPALAVSGANVPDSQAFQPLLPDIPLGIPSIRRNTVPRCLP